jgi:SAM-dependent methyltransferase
VSPEETGDANALYPLGAGQTESTRLLRQAEELAPASAAMLDRVGLVPGQCAIDLGCGPRGILSLLAERVSPGGRVVGADSDPARVGVANEFFARNGLGVVDVIVADARHTGLAPEQFDLVHARTLLINVPEPGEVVAEMVRLARPGGWVAAMEPDSGYELCYPSHPAVERVHELYLAAFGRDGADPRIGRRVPELFRLAGLDGVEVSARLQMYPAGFTRRTIRVDLVRSLRPRILELGLASAAELEEVDAGRQDSPGRRQHGRRVGPALPGVGPQALAWIHRREGCLRSL